MSANREGDDSNDNDITDTDFTTVSSQNGTGLGLSDDPRNIFKRAGFSSLVNFVDGVAESNCIGFVDGLPGTGKSTALLWALLQPKYKHKKIVWFHFDRNGVVTHRAFKECGRERFSSDNALPGTMNIADMHSYDVDADSLVIDGANDDNFVPCKLELLKFWGSGKKNQKRKCAFLTKSSKIKRLHQHEVDVLEEQHKRGLGVAQRYFTMHSWTLEEYLEAFIVNGQRSPLFVENSDKKVDWDIEDDMENKSKKRSWDGRNKVSSVEEVITQKFVYAGGSVRWMLQKSTAQIDNEILDWLDECDDPMNMLSFTFGTKSPLAKTHLFSSFENATNGRTEYAMVSERATQLVVDKCGENAIKALYKRATSLQNPSFLGWVIEADLFERAKSGHIVLKKRGVDQLIPVECQQGAFLEFDYGYILQLRFENDNDLLVDEVKKLVPEKGQVRTCKSKAWIQGGFDVVFIEVDQEDGSRIHVRLGQVAKSASHSLKLKYFAEFLQFFACATYKVVSVEMAFIVPLSKIDDFRMTYSDVKDSGRLGLYTRYGTAPTEDATVKQKNCWTKFKEHEQIDVYGLDMQGMGYSTSI